MLAEFAKPHAVCIYSTFKYTYMHDSQLTACVKEDEISFESEWLMCKLDYKVDACAHNQQLLSNGVLKALCTMF